MHRILQKSKQKSALRLIYSNFIENNVLFFLFDNNTNSIYYYVLPSSSLWQHFNVIILYTFKQSQTKSFDQIF